MVNTWWPPHWHGDLGNDPDELLTEEEVCDGLGISTVTARRWRQERSMPFLRLGRTIRYRRGELFQWIHDRRHGCACGVCGTAQSDWEPGARTCRWREGGAA